MASRSKMPAAPTDAQATRTTASTALTALARDNRGLRQAHAELMRLIAVYPQTRDGQTLYPGMRVFLDTLQCLTVLSVAADSVQAGRKLPDIETETSLGPAACWACCTYRCHELFAEEGHARAEAARLRLKPLPRLRPSDRKSA